MTNNDLIVDVALQYRNVRGWSPIPVGRDKKPLGPWAQFQKQLPTDSAIKRGFFRTPQPNIGVVCGAVSKIVVLDIDGEEGFQALKERGFEIPETLTVKTARGKHFYFLHPGLPTRNFVKGGSGLKLPGVDFRGDGGYVVAPPSLHETGVQYEFENDHHPAPMPTWLLELVVSSKPEAPLANAQESWPSRTDRKKQSQRISRPERILNDALERAHNGSRNDMGFWLACQLRDNHLSETEARSYLQRYAQSVRDHGNHPYTEQEAMTSLSSAYERSSREEWGRPVLTGPTGPEPQLGRGNLVDRSQSRASPDRSHRSTAATGVEKDEFPSVAGYRITREGVSWVPDDENKPDVLITHRPCWVEAHCRDGAREHWGAFLRWIDRDGGIHELPTPIGRFHEVGGSLPVELANAGLPIVPGREKKLLQYFASCHPDTRYRAATMVGWQEGLSAFVLPKETLGETSNAERVVYQPDRYSPSMDSVHIRGTLEGWQQGIAKVCEGNPALTFAVSAAFAASLFEVVGLEGGGFHLFGVTSHGKTTWLQVAASIWGDGSDPAEGRRSAFVKKWNLTKNATEGLAEAHNDLPLCLDEVGEADVRDFGRMIYQLAGGQGKARMESSTALKPPKVWRTLVLSTGELPASEAVEQEGRVMRGGQAARMVDLPACDPQTGAGIVLELHGAESPAAFVDSLKRACREHFGCAGPAFIRKILTDGKDALRPQLQKRLNGLVVTLTPSGAAAEVARVVKRMALVALAGELAIEWDLVSWEKAVPLQAARTMVERYVQSRGGVGGQAEQAVQKLRAFMFTHARSRFAEINHESQSTPNLAGYRDPREKFFYFTPEGFREACAGHAARDVARYLKEKGLLETPDNGHLTQRIAVKTSGRVRVYAVSASLLCDEVP